MQKKVGIISLYHGSYNYGGVLQAYALYKLIENEGYEAAQIRYSRKRKVLQKNLKYQSIGYLSKRLIEKFENCLCNYFLPREQFQRRKLVFDLFKNNNIKSSDKVYTAENIGEAMELYDGFVCGSDQIWNPNVVDDVYFLGFVSKNRVRFSYAPSVAITIPEEKYGMYKEALNQLDAVSVREKSTKVTLEKITGNHVEWVLDPTLVLKREQWEDILEQEHKIQEPYLLCYFLGGDRKVRHLAKQYAKKKNLKVVTLPFVGSAHKLSDWFFGDIQYYEADPAIFLTLIKDAECVITDSFHAVVFSHIFETPFWAVHRSGYDLKENRIMSLLELTKKSERYINPKDCRILEKMMQMSTLDFTNGMYELEKKQEESLQFLRTCLERISIK